MEVASIITLPPPPEWADIHPKSMPLMLPRDSAVVDAWLDPQNREVESFAWLLQPVIRTTQILTPIGRPGRRDPQGESITVVSRQRNQF
jgi:putative SOS response-associated peptidase YedK